MTNVHLRKPVPLLVAIAVSFAADAAEISAQPGSPPQRPLSDAMAEALQSPFHRAAEIPGSQGRHPLVPSTASPHASSGHADAGASPAPRSPDLPLPAATTAPSDGKVFLSAAFAAAVGYFGTFYLAELCEPEPGRYDGGSILLGSRESEEARIPCPVKDGDVMWMGLLGTIPVTAVGATLAGSGFARSLLGSAAGFASGMGALVGIALIGDWIQEEGNFEISEGAGAVMLSLAHAAVTTLIAN